MNTTCVEANKMLYVNPSIMDNNIIRNIIQLYRQKYEKTCDEKVGYIVSINSIKKLENVISRDSNHIQFCALLEMSAIKPEKGLRFTFTPSLIIQKGIFGKIYDISILIPEDFLKSKGWTFHENSFVNGKNGQLTTSTAVDAMIMNYQFAGSKYNCICDIVS